MSNKESFDPDLVKAYPRAHRKVSLGVRTYSLLGGDEDKEDRAITNFISPYGLEFQAPKDYQPGTLLKILISLPDYWNLKQRFVDYGRIDTPREFRVLAKVINTEGVGKTGRRKKILAQTVNIDEIDQQVLKHFLDESK